MGAVKNRERRSQLIALDDPRFASHIRATKNVAHGDTQPDSVREPDLPPEAFAAFVPWNDELEDEKEE